ncbi:hypothetical protein A2899_01650 [Candidatus Amesbacteria bacterium RIFCSPLOWO2_01_FULL_49_25]|uniref:Glycosyltransferase 2-like domain-containing protein n=1 Tax=Candidatus Amesbacteria bacterium RIFCSPHIGHO2_01_FULL_48_32b TaxID=1797253 RepID=A0A1F4YD95_9BACT|nr:MAG: hypothetical protein A2876_03310 [Candidatus Amesbacteria bacterium RIFCSPHIGHO2_01_FULL_48_32b]OGD08480.1 MAG: hypothetical protein A2899_01650 [Candidatus Amesbacteria bacterium RIFCSPLOWO2_01_FULL_49_25]
MLKIIAHCMVKNEERFIWYALNSVLDFVDKIMVWDTGSSDKTVPIIQLLKSPKIEFKEVGSVDIHSFTAVRQQMLEVTPGEFTWLMILDGDEIWPQSSIKSTVQYCRLHPDCESVVVRTRNLVGDIYHSLPESTGHYHLTGRVGHLSLRFLNLKAIPGLHVARPHGQQGYFDQNNQLVQEHKAPNTKFLDIFYHHATHLNRSSMSLKVPKRQLKYKLSLGAKLPLSEIPSIFFIPHPQVVPDATLPAPISYWIKSVTLSPLKLIKSTLALPHQGY